jgi:hypothetical protein
VVKKWEKVEANTSFYRKNYDDDDDDEDDSSEYKTRISNKNRSSSLSTLKNSSLRFQPLPPTQPARAVKLVA